MTTERCTMRIRIADYSICVPADENLKNRLRFPIGKGELRKQFPILSSKACKLPDDRREGHLHLQQMLKDGQIDSLCKIIMTLPHLVRRGNGMTMRLNC